MGEYRREGSFVEVGANDGLQHDHLRSLITSRPWHGIMVEPVPFVFARLRQTYAGMDRVILENVAIADREGPLPFYHLAQARPDELARLPQWYDGIGSFSREALLRHRRHIPDIDERLVRVDVPCLTFEGLCQKHRVGEIDVLVIDTEGYDHEILRSIDLAVHRPRLVVYEHYHLTPIQRRDSRRRLEDAGWQTMEEGFDTWCLLTEPDDRMTRMWRGLRPGVPGAYAEDEPDFSAKRQV